MNAISSLEHRGPAQAIQKALQQIESKVSLFHSTNHNDLQEQQLAKEAVGTTTTRLPEAQVPGEVPVTNLDDKAVDIVARNVLKAARKNACGKTGEYCDIKLVYDQRSYS